MVGTIVSHYRILERLGGGGMGVVYRAEDLRLRRIVAIKFLPFDLTRDPEAKERFIQEARSASAVNHPNISAIHDLDETSEGQLFIVQEYHGRRTLKDMLASRRRLGADEALGIALQIASGLAEVHRKGIIHRDIKPSNIMVDDDGTAKIVDFGLAKLLSQSSMTKAGVTVGTPSYMAPEQLRGAPSTKNTDVWGLGVVLYEMLTGHRPFESDFQEGVIYAILHEYPPPMRNHRADLPPDLDRVVARALQQNPDRRYPDMESMASDLQLIRRGTRLTGVGGALRSLVRTGPRRQRAAMILAAVLAAFLLLFALPPALRWFSGTPARSVAVVSCGDRTGNDLDPHLLYAVSDALSRYLSAFPQIQVVTVSRLADLGERMGRPPLRTDENVPVLSTGTAQEVCGRENIDLMLVPLIVKLPSGDYTLTTELKDIRTKRLVATALSHAGPADELMDAIREVVGQLLRELDVPPAEAAARVEAIAAVTTRSIDAYRHFALALHPRCSFHTGRFGYHIRRALECDSTFGPAYMAVAAQEARYFNFRAAREVSERAKDLGVFGEIAEGYQDGQHLPLSWQDRYGLASMTRRTARQEAVVDRHPDDKTARTILGRLYREEGRIEEAVRELEEALSLDPSYVPALNEMAWIHSYFRKDFATALDYMNRIESIEPGSFVSTGSRACIRYMMGDIDHSLFLQSRTSENAPSWNAPIMISCVYALQEEYGVAEMQISSHVREASTPFMRAQGLLAGAYLQIWRGRLEEAQEQIRRCLAIADSTENGALRAEAEWVRLWSTLYGPGAVEAVPLPEIWVEAPDLERISNPWYAYYRGLVDLRSGRADSLETYARSLEAMEARLIPRDREIAQSLAVILRRERYLLLDSSQAAMALLHNAPDFETLVPHINYLIEPGMDGPRTSMLFSFSGDLEARIHIAVGDTERAILEYERILRKDPGRRLWIPPLHHFSLAELYERMRAPERAVEHYEQFLSIWDKADTVFTQPRVARDRLQHLLRGRGGPSLAVGKDVYGTAGGPRQLGQSRSPGRPD